MPCCAPATVAMATSARHIAATLVKLLTEVLHISPPGNHGLVFVRDGISNVRPESRRACQYTFGTQQETRVLKKYTLGAMLCDALSACDALNVQRLSGTDDHSDYERRIS